MTFNVTINKERLFAYNIQVMYVVIINQIVALNIWFVGHVPLMNNLFDSELDGHIISHDDNIKHPFCSDKSISQAHTSEF